MNGFGRRTVLCALAGGSVAAAGCLGRDGDSDGEPGDGDSDGTAFGTETVAEGFDVPWGLTFLPDGELLVTELPGRLHRLDPADGTTTEIGGVPEVHAVGQGGLLDVAPHPGYPDPPWVYLTYAATNGAGESTTHLGRGRLEPDGTRLSGVETLHAAEPFVDSTQHYGSRVAFGPDGMAYLTVGDRGFKDFGTDHVSQDTATELGATLRLAPDGSIPSDNPFVDDEGVVDSIFSYGHRNCQGLAVHPETDELWVSEHGERDGDEINVLQRGGNHGWPIAHYGCDYGTDDPVGDRPHERDDTVDPAYHWPCGSGGFPPAGMTFYTGEAFPAWRGDLFVGNLAGQYLGRFTLDDEVESAGALLEGRGWRIRDVAVGPEGYLYVAADAEAGPIVRLVPA